MTLTSGRRGADIGNFGHAGYLAGCVRAAL